MNQEGWVFWKRKEEESAGGEPLERSGSGSPPAGPPAGPGVDEDSKESESTKEGDDQPVVEQEPDDRGDAIEVPTGQFKSPTIEDEDTFDAAEPPAEEQQDDIAAWEEDPPIKHLAARPKGTLSKPGEPQAPLTPQQKLLLLDTWLRSGLPARDFGAMVNVSRHTLYAWKRRFQEQGPAGLMDKPRGVKTGSRLPELTKRTILMLKQSHPEWGCQRISDMLLRGPALPASASAVAKVLHEAGYEMEEVPTESHKAPVRSFERAKPNQLWQTDLFSFMLKRQNRRVYLVAFMDDHSRFITGYGLHASQSAALVIETLRASLAAYGVPAEILTDNGAQYITWRGKSQFTKELEKRGIQQIVARPRRPQTLGKIERFWGSLWRECVQSSVFLDLADARQRIGLYIDHYNLQRPHQGIDGLVPADRFFGAAPEVLKTLKQRVAENALELARNGVPKKPFYLTGQLDGKPFSVHRAGDRVLLHQAEQPGEEIDLVAPPQDELPEALCPDGSPESLPSTDDDELLPGESPVDGLGKALDACNTPSSDESSSAEQEQQQQASPAPGGEQ